MRKLDSVVIPDSLGYFVTAACATNTNFMLASVQETQSAQLLFARDATRECSFKGEKDTVPTPEVLRAQ